MTKTITMKTHYLAILLAVLFSAMTNTLLAQTDPSQPHQVCMEAIEPYQVDYLDGPSGTPGSTYTWTLNVGTATITGGQGTNAITIDWGLTPPGL